MRALLRAWRPGRAIVAIPAVLLLLQGLAAPPPARGEVPPTAGDPCPEPNNQYQAACWVASNEIATGYLSDPDDVDVFRFDVLDFGTTIQLEMMESPRPYRMVVVNWEGDPLGETAQESATAEQRTLRIAPPSPGSYYVIVDPRFGGPDAVSPAEPYRLVVRPTYPGPVPNVVYAADFRRPAIEFNGERDWGRYFTDGGKYHVDMRRGSPTENQIAAATAWWGPSLTDFTFVADVRMLMKGDHAGFLVGFRGTGLDASELVTIDDAELRNGYLVLADTRERRLLMTRLVEGRNDILVPWRSVAKLNQGDSVNRIVVRSSGATHLVNVNGDEVLKLDDSRLTAGKLVLGAISFGNPVEVIYDNVLITTPR